MQRNIFERFSSKQRAIRAARLVLSGGLMTIDELMDAAATACIDEREAYLILFTEGLNGYVCRNEGSALESRALFRGTYRECQIWVERRGIAAALRLIRARLEDVAEVTEAELMGRFLLARLLQDSR